MDLTTEFIPGFSNDTSDSFSLISTSVFVAFGLMGVIDNGLVLFVIGMTKELQNPTNLLIANQSLLDLTTSAFLLALTLVPVYLAVVPRLVARFVCAFWLTWYPFWMSVTASSVNLVVVTFERYYAIAFPLQYRQSMNKKRTVILSIIPWLYGIIFNLFFFAWTEVNADHSACYTFMWPNERVKTTIGVLIFAIQFLGLICIITVLYVLIAISLRRGISHQSDAVNLRERARRNVLETLLLVFLCYVVCWAPNDIYSLNYYLREDLEFEGILYDMTVLMAFANAWINPIIYSFRYVKFQKALKVLFCCEREEKAQTVHITTGHPTQT